MGNLYAGLILKQEIVSTQSINSIIESVEKVW